MDRITRDLEDESVEKFSFALCLWTFFLNKKQNALSKGSPTNVGI